MQDQNYERKISILDCGIIISSILLLLAVYLPQSIWNEEQKLREEGRHRMTSIADAEEFYFEIRGEYTLDGRNLFALVEAAMDSLIGDSLFTGEQVIYLDSNPYPVSLERGFGTRVDTTFSEPVELYHTYPDTIYTVGMKNIESGGTDTLFVNARDLPEYKTKEHFQALYGSDIVTRSEIVTDYLRKKFHLDNYLLNCPITGDPYIFVIDTTADDEPFFRVTSPLHILEVPYTESRFAVFTFEAGDHGFIKGGVKSWAE